MAILSGGKRSSRLALFAGLFLATPLAAQPAPAPDTIATFSILGYDPATGEVGGAIQSHVFSVGNGLLWARAGVGAVVVQAIADVSYGPRSLELLERGLPVDEVVRRVHDEDPDRWRHAWPKTSRQFAVIDAEGRHAVFTGAQVAAWAGHASGRYAVAQGNLLASEDVVTEMIRAYEAADGHLAERLVAALRAGQAAGGDVRGMQSAALIVVKKDGGVWLNNDVVMRLQVDDHPDPIGELNRLVDLALEAHGRMEALRRAVEGTRSERDGPYDDGVDPGGAFWEHAKLPPG